MVVLGASRRWRLAVSALQPLPCCRTCCCTAAEAASLVATVWVEVAVLRSTEPIRSGGPLARDKKQAELEGVEALASKLERALQPFEHRSVR